MVRQVAQVLVQLTPTPVGPIRLQASTPISAAACSLKAAVIDARQQSAHRSSDDVAVDTGLLIEGAWQHEICRSELPSGSSRWADETIKEGFDDMGVASDYVMRDNRQAYDWAKRSNQMLSDLCGVRVNLSSSTESAAKGLGFLDYELSKNFPFADRAANCFTPKPVKSSCSC